MKHTLGTAAKACGVGRSTIFRAIKNGRISATKDESGNYAIDPAELHRVFPPVGEEHAENQPMERYATGDEPGGTAVLRAKIEGLEGLLQRERETVEDLRRRLDFADEERRRLTTLLTYQPETKPFQAQEQSLHHSDAPKDATPLRNPLFEKLFGRRKVSE